MYIKCIKKVVLILLVTVTMVAAYGCGMLDSQTNANKDKPPISNNGGGGQEAKKQGVLTVHFIDVGQADSILIKTPSDRTMLIDAGNNADADKVVEYLEKQGISKLDILIGTHPHEDHIGGLDAVIKEFSIGRFYMPKVSATTKTFKDVINAAKSGNIAIIPAKSGVKLDLGNEVSAKILSPVSDKYEELNDYSAVIKLTYGDISFLFTGDAEKKPEDEMINSNEDLSADVLKVGHHGSSSSTGDRFLKAVNPEYAVISVGKDNDYKHPSSSTVTRLKKNGIKILRTDEMGTIVLRTDGKNVEIKK